MADIISSKTKLRATNAKNKLANIETRENTSEDMNSLIGEKKHKADKHID